MSGCELAPRRARARILAGAAAATLLGGCSGAAATSDLSATGRTLTIYASAPPSAIADQGQRDVLDAEALAFSQKASEVTAYRLSFARLTASKPSDNARTAIQNTSAIAYLGELVPGASGDSLGITNAQQLLQVSPTDTASALTQPTSAVPNSPQRYYESLKTYNRTFARVVPTTVLEARAQVQQMRALGVSSVYLAGDGSDYAKALLASLRADLSGMTVSSGPPTAAGFAASGAQALFLATTAQPTAARLFAAVSAGHPGVKLFGPSPLADPSFAARLGSSTPNLYVSSPGLLPSNLTADGRSFISTFRSAYGHQPAPEAIFGYEAMSALLDVLKEGGGSANSRGVIVRDFLAIKNRPSALGTYSMNPAGDTSLSTFVFERLRAGKLVPVAQVQG